MRDLLVPLPAGSRPRAAVEERLRTAIRDGRLAAGSALPSTRSLASDLGIARSTVVAAYEQLAVEGYVHTQQGRATIVADVSASPSQPDDRNPLGPAPLHDFRPGEPEVGSFPRREWQQSMRRVMADAPDSAFGYGDPRGLPDVREALASYLARVRMVNVDSGAIRVYGGFSASLGFIGEALRRRKVERVAVEQPMLPFHREILELVGLETVPVDVDGHGLAVEALADLDVGAVMLTPSNHQPLGVALSSERRHRLIDWARSTGGWIIEDDYDGEFRYDRKPIGALQGLDRDRVIYAGTASKSIAPGLHLSWLVVPPALRRDMAAVTHLRAGVSTINQLVLADLLNRGAYDRHVRQQRRTYRQRRETLAERLSAMSWLEIAPSDAGMHLVTHITDAAIDEAAVIAKAAAVSVGLIGLRTHFGHHSPGLIINVSRPPSHHFTRATEELLAVLDSVAG